MPRLFDGTHKRKPLPPEPVRAVSNADLSLGALGDATEQNAEPVSSTQQTNQDATMICIAETGVQIMTRAP